VQVGNGSKGGMCWALVGREASGNGVTQQTAGGTLDPTQFRGLARGAMRPEACLQPYPLSTCMNKILMSQNVVKMTKQQEQILEQRQG
jgi:hypothetical protein